MAPIEPTRRSRGKDGVRAVSSYGFTLTSVTADALREKVPAGARAAFVDEAIAERLARLPRIAVADDPVCPAGVEQASWRAAVAAARRVRDRNTAAGVIGRAVLTSEFVAEANGAISSWTAVMYVPLIAAAYPEEWAIGRWPDKPQGHAPRMGRPPGCWLLPLPNAAHEPRLGP